MAKKINNLEDIAKEIEQYSRDIAQQMARNTRDKLAKTAEIAIKKFYDHYDPIVYDRHTPLMGNIRKSFRKFYANPHNTVFRGGIELSPEWMDDLYSTPKHPVDKDMIFNLIYAGYHGNVGMFPVPVETVPPIMDPSPLDILLNTRDNLMKKAVKDANKVARALDKSKYKYIK